MLFSHLFQYTNIGLDSRFFVEFPNSHRILSNNCILWQTLLSMSILDQHIRSRIADHCVSWKQITSSCCDLNILIKGAHFPCHGKNSRFLRGIDMNQTLWLSFEHNLHAKQCLKGKNIYNTCCQNRSLHTCAFLSPAASVHQVLNLSFREHRCTLKTNHIWICKSLLFSGNSASSFNVCVDQTRQTAMNLSWNIFVFTVCVHVIFSIVIPDRKKVEMCDAVILAIPR